MRDWSAVPYPAWWIARAAERRVELDRAVDRIRTVVRESDDIVGALVFGSYATGKVGPESDLDVMLVTTTPANGDPGLRYALLITNPKNSHGYRSSVGSSHRHCVKAYGSMQRHPRELAASWLAQATRDLDAARYLFAGVRYDAACFSAQQAAEKALEAALVSLVGDRPRTHQISVLIAEISGHRPEAVEALGDLAALDPYYVTTRYPDAIGGAVPGMSFFEPEARLALDRAARAVTYVEKILGE